MDRLTEKHWRNLDPWECCGQDHYCQRGCHEPGGCTKGCIVPKLYRRLATYEDAEQAGRLVIYPCKVGELVWLIDTRFFQRDKTRLPVIRCLVNEFSSDGTHTYIILDGAEPWYKMRRFRSVDITDFGRILFKTKNEAAAALGRDIDVPCKKEG